MAARVCQNCGNQNPPEARFCMSCGNALEAVCPSCGTVAPPEAKFCMACGTAIAGGEGQPAPAALPPRPAATDFPEERRQVSVLFADLSGYTAVAERMDPEAVKAMLDGTLRQLGEEVIRFGGRVDKYIGDNVMAVFGAPVAHEDDPERAVRAGLAMQETMERLNKNLADEVSFMLRVGINSGEGLAGR